MWAEGVGVLMVVECVYEGARLLFCIIKRLFPAWGFSARTLHVAFLLCFHLNVCSLRHMEESLPETLNQSRSNEGEGSHH